MPKLRFKNFEFKIALIGVSNKPYDIPQSGTGKANYDELKSYFIFFI